MSYKSLKPVFDYMLILLFLIPILIITFLILVGYLFQAQFPILFSQYRIGKNGKPFIMHKFRTLSTDTTQSLTARRFAWGNLLRITNLDELPQLWNVLRGDMSIIGPRPLPLEYQPLFSPEQNKRHEVRPGITGLAQISGKNNLPWPEKFKHDLDYITRCSLWLDLTILFKTFLLALSLKQDTSLNEEKFSG
ncbi:MAG: sugar transferase [Cyclobacteriaceae bacterium]|nr:sugar transferase [Cyclobacteriaceae bacterium]